MGIVWHKCLLMRISPARKSWSRITRNASPPLKPLQMSKGIARFCLIVHGCICNGVNVSSFLNECFWIVCWKPWFMIASLVYALVSSGAVSVVANLGRIKLLGALTSACGSGVHRSSHLHKDTHTYAGARTHKQKSKLPFHTRAFILKGID